MNSLIGYDCNVFVFFNIMEYNLLVCCLFVVKGWLLNVQDRIGEWVFYYCFLVSVINDFFVIEGEFVQIREWFLEKVMVVGGNDDLWVNEGMFFCDMFWRDFIDVNFLFGF